MSIQLELRVTPGVPVYRGHDHYWSVMRDLGKNGAEFTLAEIASRSNDPRDKSIGDFLQRLIKAEIVAVRPVEGGGLQMGFPFGSKVDAPGWERVYRIPDPIERVLKAAGKGALNTGPAQTVGTLATSPPPRFAAHKARKSPHGQAVSPGAHIAGTGLVPSTQADRHLAASVRGAQTRFADWQSRFAYLVPVQASHARRWQGDGLPGEICRGKGLPGGPDS